MHLFFHSKKELPLSKGETLFREVFNLRKAGRTARKWIKFDEFGQTKAGIGERERMAKRAKNLNWGELYSNQSW